MCCMHAWRSCTHLHDADDASDEALCWRLCLWMVVLQYDLFPCTAQPSIHTWVQTPQHP